MVTRTSEDLKKRIFLRALIPRKGSGRIYYTCSKTHLIEHVFSLTPALTLTLTLNCNNIFGLTKWRYFSRKCTDTGWVATLPPIFGIQYWGPKFIWKNGILYSIFGPARSPSLQSNAVQICCNLSHNASRARFDSGNISKAMQIMEAGTRIGNGNPWNLWTCGNLGWWRFMLIVLECTTLRKLDFCHLFIFILKRVE